MKNLFLVSILLISSALVSTTSAQVIVSSPSAVLLSDPEDDDVWTANFDITASTTENSMVAVFVGFDDRKAADPSISSITLAGQAMTEGHPVTAGTGESDDLLGALYYLPAQVAGANAFSITVDAELGNDPVVKPFVLTNVNENVAPVTAFGSIDKNTNDGGTDLLTLQLTPPSDGSAVLGFTIIDGNGSTSSDFFPSANDKSVNPPETGDYWSSWATDISATQQSIDLKASSANHFGYLGMAASFAQIPEPSSLVLLLMGCGTFILLRRRR